MKIKITLKNGERSLSLSLPLNQQLIYQEEPPLLYSLSSSPCSSPSSPTHPGSSNAKRPIFYFLAFILCHTVSWKLSVFLIKTQVMVFNRSLICDECLLTHDPDWQPKAVIALTKLQQLRSKETLMESYHRSSFDNQGRVGVLVWGSAALRTWSRTFFPLLLHKYV